MKERAIELFGWYGAVAVVTAYALMSFQVIDPYALSYQLLNVTGSLGILTVSLYKRAYQPAALNFVWVLISLGALLNIFR